MTADVHRTPKMKVHSQEYKYIEYLPNLLQIYCALQNCKTQNIFNKFKQQFEINYPK